MEITARALFPSPVWTALLDDAAALNLQLASHAYALREQDPAGVANTNMNGWQSNNTIQRLEQFREINERIIGICQHIGATCGFARTAELRYQAWVNINPPGAWNSAHIHPNCHLSGVYYITAPAASGSIYFRDPRVASTMAPPPIDTPGEFTASEVALAPEAGRIYVFPAWLEHGVRPNRGSEDRVGISFNVQAIARPGQGR